MADPGGYFRRPVHFARLRQVFLSIDKIIGERELTAGVTMRLPERSEKSSPRETIRETGDIK